MSDFAGSSQTSRPPSVGQGPARVERPADPKGESRPDQQTASNSPKSNPAEQPAPKGHHFHEPAVALAPSFANLEVGTAVQGEVAEVDADGRPLVRSGDALYALKPDAGLKPGDRVDIRIIDASRKLEGELIRHNHENVDPPVRLSLTLVGVAGQAFEKSAEPAPAPATLETAALYRATRQALSQIPEETAGAILASQSSPQKTPVAEVGSVTQAQPGSTDAVETGPGIQRGGVIIRNIIRAFPLAEFDAAAEQPEAPPVTHSSSSASTHPSSPVIRHAAETGHARTKYLPPVLRGTVIDSHESLTKHRPHDSAFRPGTTVTAILLPGQASGPSGQSSHFPDAEAARRGDNQNSLATNSRPQLSGDSVAITRLPADSTDPEGNRPGPVVLRVAGTIEPNDERYQGSSSQFESAGSTGAIAADPSGEPGKSSTAAILSTPIGRIALTTGIPVAVGTQVTALLVADLSAGPASPGPISAGRQDMAPHGSTVSDQVGPQQPAIGQPSPIPDLEENGRPGREAHPPNEEVTRPSAAPQAIPGSGHSADQPGTGGSVAASELGRTEYGTPVTKGTELAPAASQTVESSSNLAAAAALLESYSREWPALNQAFTAAATVGPEAQSALGERIVSDPGRLPNVLLFLLQAAGRGDPRAWLGTFSAAMQASGKADVMDRLQDDISRLLTVAGQTGGEWRAIPIPALNENNAHLIHLFLREGGDDNTERHSSDQPNNDADDDGRDRGTRFVVHIAFKRLGEVQLDGRIQQGHFNLAVHSSHEFTQEEQRVARSLFARKMESQEMSGKLSFHRDTALPVDVGAVLRSAE